MKRLVPVLAVLLAGSSLAHAQGDEGTSRSATTNAPEAGPVITPPSQSAPPPASNATPDLSAPASPPISGSSVPPPAQFSLGTPSPNAPSVQNDDIYDIRPPFFFLRSWAWPWVLLVALALVSLLVGLWIWFKPLRASRTKSAYELALENLGKARSLLDEENPEPYAVAVSETIRGYLTQRFQTPSTRRTTEEFLREMQKASSPLLVGHRDLLRDFLEACDLVKFAHYQPSRGELEQVHERAVTFVTATKPVEASGASSNAAAVRSPALATTSGGRS